MNIKTEYLNFIKLNFSGLEIKMPLFYNWDLGLRFDLQQEFTNPVCTDDDGYFKEVYHRAKNLFDFCFNKEDQVYVAIFSYKWRKQRIRKSNFIFKLFKDQSHPKLEFSKISNRYESNEKWNRLIIKKKVENIDIDNLVKGLCNTDFPMMKPSISEEVYLININKKLIFHVYDDRGLDILATNKKNLLDIYNNFDSWILEYDREKIKAQLNI